MAAQGTLYAGAHPRFLQIPHALMMPADGCLGVCVYTWVWSDTQIVAGAHVEAQHTIMWYITTQCRRDDD